MATDWNAIGWAGFSLGGTDEGADRLRVLGRDEGVVGIGPTVIAAESSRTAGGIHLGRSTSDGLHITIPTLQCRKRSTARRFAQSMEATNEEAMLEFAGLLWADDDDPDNEALGHRVAAWVRPTGVRITGDVLALGGPGVQHLTNASWVAPDPTLYDAVATPFTRSTPADQHSVSWTNPGTSTPAPGLGGRAWTLSMTAVTTVVRPYVMAGSRRVTFRNLTLTPGQTLNIGPSRRPWVGSRYAVGFSGSPPQPSPEWPLFEPGTPRNLVMGCQSGTFTAAGELRGTW